MRELWHLCELQKEMIYILMVKYAALQQPAVMRSVLADLRNRLERSRQLTHLFDEDEARWRDGMESGLETAIEFLEDALKKHFS